jgi:hypothetical protein
MFWRIRKFQLSTASIAVSVASFSVATTKSLAKTLVTPADLAPLAEDESASYPVTPRVWLNWYFEACANNGGNTPADVTGFLPWNLAPERLSELQAAHTGAEKKNSS